jgi:protein transport protein SEC39
MADLSLVRAKAILLVVQAVIKADIPALRTLVAHQRKTLRTDIILRILLTYLPESLDSSKYVPFLQDLASGKIPVDHKLEIDTSAIDEISNADANKKVKKLHLLPLAWPSAPADAPEDPFILFLIHRAYRVDEETGLITQLPELIVPFLNYSQYLRTWMISTLLPLLRLNYDYHAQESTLQTIRFFESLDDRTGVEFLLSRTGKNVGNEGDSNKTIGRDLRGLIGPWMYGDSQWKRRRVSKSSDWDTQRVTPLDEVVPEDPKSAGWEEVFKWITFQATNSWVTCLEAIEQWDGPGDVDLGGYWNGTVWLEEHEQQSLERRYARAALAAAYLIPEASVEALTGVQRILARLVALLDLDRIPTLPAAAALLAPIPAVGESAVATAKNAIYLRTALMGERNVLTTPNSTSISLLYGILISAYLLTRAGVQCTIRRAGELVLLQDEREQTFEFQRLIHKLGNGPKGDDKYWTRVRNELLWLRDWGEDELSGGTEGSQGRGVFGKVRKDFLETEMLKALLANTRKFTLLQDRIASYSSLSPHRLYPSKIHLRDLT